MVRVLRENLEGVLAPNLAMAILFDALAAWGPIRPQTPAELIRFVRGPLMERLVPKLGADEAASVGARIVAILSQAITPPTPPTGAPRPRIPGARYPKPDDRSTTPLPTWELPVLVLVASGQPIFADRLTAAVGAERVNAVTAHDLAELTRGSHPYAPGVIVVDAQHPPGIEPDDLVRALATPPPTVLRTLWGGETPWGARLLASALRAAVILVELDGAEGILPLCDIVRSLRRETR